MTGSSSDTVPAGMRVAVDAPAPGCDGIVWCLDLAPALPRLDACLGVLSRDETERAARFLRARDRARFVASHAGMRLILARALGAAPVDLAFAVGAGGKPELAGRWAGRLDFNLSHSGDRALVGASRSARIGVDVEAIRPVPDALRIADHHFSAREAAALRGFPSDSSGEAFFALWTRKEAVVKALGLGLAFGLPRFSVSLPPDSVRVIEIDGSTAAARAWTLGSFAPADGYAGAVAVAAPAAAIEIRHAPVRWIDGLA